MAAKMRFILMFWRVWGNFIDIAREFSLNSVHTAEKYVSYLEEAFLIRIIHKYSFKSSERVSGRKAYTVDLAFATNKKDTLTTANIGWRLEAGEYRSDRTLS